MTWTATNFQSVLDVMKQSWRLSLQAHLVNGQHAITYDKIQWRYIQYVTKYATKANYWEVECAQRGRIHDHIVLEWIVE